MKNIITALAGLFLCVFTIEAENCRFVSVTCTNANTPSTIQILQGETAEIVSAYDASTTTVNQYSTNTVDNPTAFSVSVLINGYAIRGWPAGIQVVPNNNGNYYMGVIPHGTIVAGPATIALDSGTLAHPRLLTVKIIPDSYDVNKTLILPPGTNQFQVTLQTSTNLVSWSVTTNGVYGSPDTARFFRVSMGQLPSQ
jgi:hypothetical protein